MAYYWQVNDHMEIWSLIESEFFKAVGVLVLLYGCTIKKRLEKKLDAVCCFERILEAAPYKKEVVRRLTSYLTIHLRRKRDARYCWRSKDELISNVLPWTPIYGHTNFVRSTKIYIHQVCADTGEPTQCDDW